VLLENLLPLLGWVLSLVQLFIRRDRRRRFWLSVKSYAAAQLADAGNHITDPKEAAEKALIAAQHEEVAKIERSLKASIPPPIAPREEPNPDNVSTARIPVIRIDETTKKD